ncbi:hypothetical protein DID88_004356 [Monilinia fructigena]|uniref:Polymerase nucleotidyl transferase domain-containing protein n=1 Tax=Monilinia fructigena TaxID=38457 RepID=A0A395ISI7_9HELO|nr:hypothetical protein DID88_004356 [Monilinia fructigena]
MNSQLSIPIDTRQQQQQQQQQKQQHHNHHHHHHQQQQQHQQSPSASPQNYAPHLGQQQPTPSTTQNYNDNRGNNQRVQQHQHQQFSPRFPNQTPTSSYTTQTAYQNHPSSDHQFQKPMYPQQHQQHSWQNMNQASPGPGSFSSRPAPQNRQLYQPSLSTPSGQGRRNFVVTAEELASQSAFLDKLAEECVPKVAIDTGEANKKEEFRAHIEKICRAAITKHEQEELGNKYFDASTVELKCYGSLSSGFATKGSDMDLAILTPFSNPSAESSESQIPRLLEKKVPIIKLCEKPPENLMADLLEERKKWENGLVECQDDDDADEKYSESQTTKSPEQTPVDANSKAKSSTKTTSNTSKLINKGVVQPVEKKEVSLKQKEHQNLVDYQICAKRALRKHGGRDLSLNSTDLNMEEAKLLNEESDALTVLEVWKGLQNRTGPITESELYNRQLHAASERLKKINSLQFLCLEQLMFESPKQYLAKVEKIKGDLEGRGLPQHLIRLRKLNDEEVVALFVKHYIDGIHDSQIREAMQCMEGIATLNDAARRHQILQLAKDYEHALEVNLYDEDSRRHVEQYIPILRDMASRQASVDSSQAELVAIMRTLPDPTQISLNKPRDRYKDHLEFPKDKVGIQCDINFSNHLALHNTLLLRLYSVCDPRVKIMVLGTLGSYGYVLMVLHYLMNIAQPPVLPNLQHMNKEPPAHLSPSEKAAQTSCDGQDVRFWRNETEIRSLAERKMLTHNHDSMTTVHGVRGFEWGREVLSLRSKYGILSKQEKGWVGARTVVETTQIAAPTPTTPKLSTPAIFKTLWRECWQFIF